MITSRSAVNFARLGMMFVCLLWFGVLAVRAAPHYIVPPGTAGVNPTPNYTSWGTAATNIQLAVDVAALDETVWVTNGAYCVTNQIMITNRITLKSMNGYSNTLVYADWPAQTNIRCFYVTSTGTVDGFSISNGHLTSVASYAGGGGAYVATGVIQNCYFVMNVCSNTDTTAIYTGGGGAYVGKNGVISNCLIFINTCFRASGATWSESLGGGLDVRDGLVVDSVIISNTSMLGNGGGVAIQASGIVSNCSIIHNAVRLYSAAGGVYVMETGSLLIDCIVSNNYSAGGDYPYGAGVVSYGTVRNCTIVNNVSDLHSGGISGLGGMISNCIIANNTAVQYGGGATINAGSSLIACFIFNNVANSTRGGAGVCVFDSGQVRNCLIYNNTNFAAIGGGGVYLTNASPYGLVNCTIVNNYSTNEGGGIAVFGPDNYIANCVISGNSSFSNNYPNVYNTGANSNNFWYSCANVTSAPLASGQGNITNDPRFVNASADNWRLAADSPCVNAGTNQSWMTNAVDLDGRIRIRYGTVDMGAYEVIYEGTFYKF